MNLEIQRREINTKDILIDPKAQRDVEARNYQFNKIMRTFDPALVNDIKVAFINGRFYCFDGQMTMKVLKARNGGKDLPVMCKVYMGLTDMDMANLFVNQNGTVSNVKMADKIRVLRNFGDPEMVDFCKRTENNGLYISWTGAVGKNTVAAVSALLKIYRYFGDSKDRYDEFICTVRDAWGGEPDSLRSQILWGVAMFLNTYWGQIDVQRLVKRLSSQRPIDIIRDAGVDRSSGNRKYAVQVLQIYNFGLGNKLTNLL